MNYIINKVKKKTTRLLSATSSSFNKSSFNGNKNFEENQDYKSNSRNLIRNKLPNNNSDFEGTQYSSTIIFN